MTEKQYVNQVTKRIKCSSAKRNDIRQELLADIRMRSTQGERMEDIIAGMGQPKEVAEGFNENISPQERKKYTRKKTAIILISVVIAVILLIGIAYMLLPRGIAMEDSKYFTQEQVESALKQTIEYLDEEDYDSLRANAIDQMQTYLNKETMEQLKAQLSDNWGERLQYGPVYAWEMVQGNTHYATAQVNVSYENINVTYTISFDVDMRLAGLYMK